MDGCDGGGLASLRLLHASLVGSGLASIVYGLQLDETVFLFFANKQTLWKIFSTCFEFIVAAFTCLWNVLCTCRFRWLAWRIRLQRCHASWRYWYFVDWRWVDEEISIGMVRLAHCDECN